MSLKAEKELDMQRKLETKKNASELDEPTKERLKVTEMEEMAEDDPTMMKPPFPNKSDDSSADILVRVQDCRPSLGFLGAATRLPGTTLA